MTYRLPTGITVKDHLARLIAASNPDHDEPNSGDAYHDDQAERRRDEAEHVTDWTADRLASKREDAETRWREGVR